MTPPSLLCRGKVLAAFLKSIGFIIPLMDAMYANYYTREVMVILVREFQTPDEEMKKIVLKVVKQCVGTDGVEPDYIRHEILPEFFRNFWVRRMALDRRNYRQLVETTVELANKVGFNLIAAAPHCAGVSRHCCAQRHSHPYSVALAVAEALVKVTIRLVSDSMCPGGPAVMVPSTDACQCSPGLHNIAMLLLFCTQHGSSSAGWLC